MNFPLPDELHDNTDSCFVLHSAVGLMHGTVLSLVISHTFTFLVIVVVIPARLKIGTPRCTSTITIFPSIKVCTLAQHTGATFEGAGYEAAVASRFAAASTFGRRSTTTALSFMIFFAPLVRALKVGYVRLDVVTSNAFAKMDWLRFV